MEQVLDQEQVLKCIGKIKMYKEEQELTLDGMNNVFKRINYLYQTENTEILNNKVGLLKNNNGNIMKNNDNNIFVLEKNISKYTDISNLNSRIFNSVE